MNSSAKFFLLEHTRRKSLVIRHRCATLNFATVTMNTRHPQRQYVTDVGSPGGEKAKNNTPLPSPNSPVGRTESTNKVLTSETINPSLKRAEYAVRGELALRAEELRQHLRNKDEVASKLPFSKVINCNIGNPQQLGQLPVTFFRQVLAMVEMPQLIDELSIPFHKDARQRARTLLDAIEYPGAYSHSKGCPSIRRTVADFIQRRDGHPADPESIFLTSGASDGVKMLLQTMINSPKAGLLVPIPQYPLYTATIALCNGNAVPYYLDEEKGWATSTDEILRALYEARAQGIDVKGIVVINPGNPTGNVLSAKNVCDIIDLCHRERLVILADEVYQTNVYSDAKPFVSFKKALKDMGPRYKELELVSFHSVSKGVIGECGRRGGYFEVTGLLPSVTDELYKLASISLCPNVSGQAVVDLMVNPPKPGDESFQLYNEQVSATFKSLRRRAEKLCKAFNELEKVSCQNAEGAMYLFPKIELPSAAIARAQALGKSPDTFYCLEMLNATGVCVVPGSGFGQKEGTFHFRATILPDETQIDNFIASIKAFHRHFMSKYS